MTKRITRDNFDPAHVLKLAAAFTLVMPGDECVEHLRLLAEACHVIARERAESQKMRSAISELYRRFNDETKK